MSIALSERFDEVIQTDVQADKLGAGQQHDFLFPTLPPEINARRPEWIITNPPFRLWTEFAERAIRIATEGVAMFGRLQAVESEKRFNRIWNRPGRKPWLFMPFSERVPILKGRVDPHADSATAYCWIVWRVGYNAAFPMVDVIPPCREKFGREDDYFN